MAAAAAALVHKKSLFGGKKRVNRTGSVIFKSGIQIFKREIMKLTFHRQVIST